MRQPDDPGLPVDEILLPRPDQVFVRNWRSILKKAWSVRLLILAALLTGLEVLLELFGYRLPLSDMGRALLFLTVTVGALIARFIAQSSIER